MEQYLFILGPFQLSISQSQRTTSQKVSLKYLTNEGEGNNFLGLNRKITNSQISVIARKEAKVQYLANFFCNVVLFDVI